MKYLEFRQAPAHELETFLIEMIPGWGWLDLQRYIADNSDGEIFAQVLRLGDQFAMTCHREDTAAVRVFIEAIPDYVSCAH